MHYHFTYEDGIRHRFALEEIEDLDFLKGVLTSGRTRGLYDGQLREFALSNKPGAKVDLTNGVFEGRKAQTVKTGFEGAKERLGKLTDENRIPNLENVEVKVKEEQVYLIRQDLM